MNSRFKHFAIKLLKKNGINGLHNLLLNKEALTDFQAYCTQLIFVLDRFDSKMDMELCLKLIINTEKRCNLSPRELLDLNNQLRGKQC